MIYNPGISKPKLEEHFKSLIKLKYNQFRWWRMYDTPRKPLDKRARLIDRINNGDFDFSHYYLQALYVEHEINEIYRQFIDDPGMFVSHASLPRQRRKRLYDDYERDEREKMEALKEGLWSNFKISKSELEDVMESFDGTILELYFYLDENYKIINQLPPTLQKRRRGRPKKV